MWVGLCNQLKALREKRPMFPLGRRNSAPDSLWTWAAPSALLWVYALPACTADFGLVSLHNHMSQFLKSISLCTHTHTHTHTHTPYLLGYWFHFFGKLWPIPTGTSHQNSGNSQLFDLWCHHCSKRLESKVQVDLLFLCPSSSHIPPAMSIPYPPYLWHKYPPFFFTH